VTTAEDNLDDDQLIGQTYMLQRVGTEQEKQSVEKELSELKERLSKVERWRKRREEIDVELGIVRVEGGDVLPPPAYIEEMEGNAQDVSAKLQSVVAQNGAAD